MVVIATGCQRLLVFARKPAPVQATTMSYPRATAWTPSIQSLRTQSTGDTRAQHVQPAAFPEIPLPVTGRAPLGRDGQIPRQIRLHRLPENMTYQLHSFVKNVTCHSSTNVAFI